MLIIKQTFYQSKATFSASSSYAIINFIKPQGYQQLVVPIFKRSYIRKNKIFAISKLYFSSAFFAKKLQKNCTSFISKSTRTFLFKFGRIKTIMHVNSILAAAWTLIIIASY